MNNELISRSAAKDEILSWAICINKPHLLSKDDTIAVLDMLPTVDAVVLPVKPGSVVWILNHKFPAEIEEICTRKDGVFAVWVEYDRGPELTEVWDDGEFDIKEIGKTVFLTVEELEKAMYPCEHCFCGSYRSCDGCNGLEQQTKHLELEDVVDLDKQTKENNAAMRKVIDFITEE